MLRSDSAHMAVLSIIHMDKYVAAQERELQHNTQTLCFSLLGDPAGPSGSESTSSWSSNSHSLALSLSRSLALPALSLSFRLQCVYADERCRRTSASITHNGNSASPAVGQVCISGLAQRGVPWNEVLTAVCSRQSFPLGQCLKDYCQQRDKR